MQDEQLHEVYPKPFAHPTIRSVCGRFSSILVACLPLMSGVRNNRTCLQAA